MEPKSAVLVNAVPPYGHVICSEKWRNSSLIQGLKGGGVKILFETELGVADFHLPNKSIILYLSECDIIAGSSYKRKLVRYRNVGYRPAAVSRRWCWWRGPASGSSTSLLCRSSWCLTWVCLCCRLGGRRRPRSSSLKWFSGRPRRILSEDGAPVGYWTHWCWRWCSRSQGWAGSKLWRCCRTSPASSSSAVHLLQSWKRLWARPALSRSTASSTEALHHTTIITRTVQAHFNETQL